MDQQNSTNRVVTVLGDLARLAAAPRGQALPLRLVSACVVILGTDGAAITLANTRHERITLCATDDVSARLEDLQEVLGQGPSTQAYEEGAAVVAHLDGENGANWPRFAAAVREQFGELSINALPIRPGPSVLGVLTAYSRGHRDLREDEETTQRLVNAVGVALIDDAGTHSAGGNPLEDAPWASRDRIHQATGMVIAQLGIGPDDALALLRAHAYAHDTTMVEISEQVVQRRLDFSATDRGEQPS